MLVVVLVIWFLLGIHSVWFFVRRYTQRNDLTTNDICALVLCLFFPIASHFATIITFPSLNPIVIKKAK